MFHFIQQDPETRYSSAWALWRLNFRGHLYTEIESASIQRIMMAPAVSFNIHVSTHQYWWYCLLSCHSPTFKAFEQDAEDFITFSHILEERTRDQGKQNEPFLLLKLHFWTKNNPRMRAKDTACHYNASDSSICPGFFFYYPYHEDIF